MEPLRTASFRASCMCTHKCQNIFLFVRGWVDIHKSILADCLPFSVKTNVCVCKHIVPHWPDSLPATLPLSPPHPQPPLLTSFAALILEDLLRRGIRHSRCPFRATMKRGARPSCAMRQGSPSIRQLVLSPRVHERAHDVQRIRLTGNAAAYIHIHI